MDATDPTPPRRSEHGPSRLVPQYCGSSVIQQDSSKYQQPLVFHRSPRTTANTQCLYRLPPIVKNLPFKIVNKGYNRRTFYASDVCPNLTLSANSLNGEINIESIRALEEQIRERESVIADLKRAETPSSDASTLPPQST